MALRTAWYKVPIRLVDREIYDKPAAFYRHPSGFALVHWRSRSRNYKYHKLFGHWGLVREITDDNCPELLRRRSYSFSRRPPRKPPIRWANDLLRRMYKLEASNEPISKSIDSRTAPLDYLLSDMSGPPDYWEKIERQLNEQREKEAEAASASSTFEDQGDGIENEVDSYATWLFERFASVA